MERIQITLSDQLARRLRAAIPARQRSKTIMHLIEVEIEKREKLLFECAAAVEKDSLLNQEMEGWDVTLQDGLNDESR